MRTTATGVIITFALLLSGCNRSEETSGLTARDVAWATGWTIWKIDLSDHEPFYGAQIVVIGPDGDVIEDPGRFQSSEPWANDRPRILTVALKKEKQSVEGKISLEGTIGFQFDDLFHGEIWTTVGEPQRSSDLYILATSSKMGRIQPQPFDQQSTKIALKVLTEPKP